jgi:hypothetical protein
MKKLAALRALKLMHDDAKSSRAQSQYMTTMCPAPTCAISRRTKATQSAGVRKFNRSANGSHCGHIGPVCQRHVYLGSRLPVPTQNALAQSGYAGVLAGWSAIRRFQGQTSVLPVIHSWHVNASYRPNLFRMFGDFGLFQNEGLNFLNVRSRVRRSMFTKVFQQQ